jgi:hypothetical protein
MSQLHELKTPANINKLLDADGDIHYRKYLDCGPDGIRETIDYMLDIYDRSSWGVFDTIFQRRGPSLPWACIFLDRDYAVADVVSDTLSDDSGIEFDYYSVMFNPKHSNEKYSMGYIWIKDKAALEKIARTSVVWSECWRVLANAGAKKHWIALLDPLPKDWSYQNENSEVFNMWHELKAHNAHGNKSDEQH